MHLHHLYSEQFTNECALMRFNEYIKHWYNKQYTLQINIDCCCIYIYTCTNAEM